MTTGLQDFLSRFSPEKRLSDQLFWMMFYVCVALLPPLISIIGRKALVLPLIILSTLVVVRFFMREDCRKRMIASIKTPAILLLLAFALLTAVHALVGETSSPLRIQILIKPVAILLVTALLSFAWSHKDQINPDLLLKLTLAGTLAGITITFLKLAAIHSFLQAGAPLQDGLVARFLHVHDAINDELKILAIFIFLAALATASVKKRWITLLGLCGALIALSFFSIGFSDRDGDIIILASSETVKFGIPLALLVLAITSIAPRLMSHFFFGGLAFMALTAPWLFQQVFQFFQTVPLPSARIFLMRGEIWDAVGRKVLESPFFGYGIESARYLDHLDLQMRYFPKNVVHHPHNMVLQIWLDVGFIGIALLVGLIVYAWKFIQASKRADLPFLLGGLTMMAIFVLVTHSVWQAWTMSLITMFAIIVSIGVPPTTADKN